MSARTAPVARTRLLDASARRPLGAPAVGTPLPAPLPDDGVAWISGSRALVGWGCARRVPVGTGDDRFAAAAAAVERFFAGLRIQNEVGGQGTGPLAFGAFSFDPDSSQSSVVVPSVIVGRDGDRSWVTTVGTAAEHTVGSAAEHTVSPARRRVARRLATTPDDRRWLELARTARAAVRDGILDKVVLARSTEIAGGAPFVPNDVVGQLATRYANCFTFAVDGLVGASPELLVRRRGRSVESVVLGGSAPRGATAAEDRAFGSALQASNKDRIEHDLAVATVHAGLVSVCERVQVDARPTLLRLPYVQHLRTHASGIVREGLGAVELAGVLHPTAAICGAPVDKALAAIRDLEGFERGRYGGPVGWIDADGDGEFAIALRCAELDGAHATLYAGAGIVEDSEPAAELDETELKLRPLLQVLGAD